MSRGARALQYRWNSADRHHDPAARTVLAISGALFSLLGLVLVAGGYLSAFNGSAFHILAGLGLIVSGALVALRHPAGAWTYMLVFAATVMWSLTNLEGGSILPLRLVGPSLLLVMIAALMPVLCRWRPRRAVAACEVLIAATVGLGLSSQPSGPLAGEVAAATQFLDAKAKGILQ